MPLIVEAMTDPAEATGEAGKAVTLRDKTGTPVSAKSEKDKSTKRKSNLNRALTEEQVVNVNNVNNESQGLALVPRRLLILAVILGVSSYFIPFVFHLFRLQMIAVSGFAVVGRAS